MKNYKLTLSHSIDLEAKDEEDAVEKYFDSFESSNQTAGVFISDNLKVAECFLASQLKGDALDKVVEKYGYINVEDSDWADRDEAPFLDIKELGLEIDDKRMCWDLDYPHRQLYFDNAHDGSGNTQIGIWIADKKKLVKRLAKDLKPSKFSSKIVKAMLNDEIELYFETRHYGGGDGKTYLNYTDRTEDAITDSIEGFDLDEALQKWFTENVVNHLLSSFQKDYDYLTSKEAVVETLDANEYLFTKDGVSL